jgi:phosphoribosyl-AMP cyclohydrolase
MPLTQTNLDSILDGIKYDAQGLVGVIVIDDKTGQPLMFAFSNRETIRRTLETGKMHYYSRSRQKIWVKGETSGHVQNVKEVRIDCDADAMLFRVEQTGGACHTGYYSCFYRKLGPDGWVEEGQKVFNPDEVYGG